MSNKNVFYILIFGSILFYSCTDFQKEKDKDVNFMSETDLHKEPTNVVTAVEILDSSITSSDFICRKNLFIYIGTLQGLNEQQHSEVYKFGQCNSGKKSFDIIWVLDKSYEQRKNIISVDFYNNTPDSIIIANFTTYLFKLPLQIVTDPLLDDPYIFPTDVEVFTLRNNKKSEYIGKYHINSWDNYIQLQYNTIFGNVPNNPRYRTNPFVW